MRGEEDVETQGTEFGATFPPLSEWTDDAGTLTSPRTEDGSYYRIVPPEYVAAAGHPDAAKVQGLYFVTYYAGPEQTTWRAVGSVLLPDGVPVPKSIYDSPEAGYATESAAWGAAKKHASAQKVSAVVDTASDFLSRIAPELKEAFTPSTPAPAPVTMPIVDLPAADTRSGLEKAKARARAAREYARRHPEKTKGVGALAAILAVGGVAALILVLRGRK